MNDYEYYSKFNWNANPFTLTISPKLMVGYSQQTKSLLSHIFGLHKIGLIIGATGSGKTTLMNWINMTVNDVHNFRSFYIAKPPVGEEGLILLFKSLLGFNLRDKLRFKRIVETNLPKYLSRKTRKKKTLFLVDEAHECSIEALEWFRTLSDIVPNMMVIFAGLPVFENLIETKLPTLYMRIMTRVYLKSLNDVETESLIRKRIESVGGKGIEPFTGDAVNQMFHITGGFPREIIKVCDKLIKEAAENNISSINKSFVERIYKISEVPSHFDIKMSLSKKQMKILEALNTNPNLTPSKIVDHLSLNNYKNKSNAVRSINNILRRLMNDGLINRKKLGNTYVYSLSGKAKTVFAEA